MTTEKAVLPTEAIFSAFRAWINQSSNIDRRDYGDGRDGFKAYWDEVRSIRKDQTRARKALRAAQAYPFNADAMGEALTRAFSGRLSWTEDKHDFANHLCTRCCAAQSLDMQDRDITITTCNKTGHFDYCTGQYFPTEFAIAAAVVLEQYADVVRPKFVPTPEQRSQWWTIEEIERANYNAGQHWFSKDTKRFFRCRVLETVYQGPGGVFFVSSEKGPNEIRRFTIREFKPETAGIDTFGPFNEMSRERAQRIARIAATYRKAAEEVV